LPIDEASCEVARALSFEPAAGAVLRPNIEYGCCTRVELVWSGGTAKVRSLFNSQRAYHPNMASLVSAADYPAAAKAAKHSGRVGFILDVGADGRVTKCSVFESSGSDILDQATCRILRERVLASPGRNAAGVAVPDTLRSRIVWKL
jgi:TonB family protein